MVVKHICESSLPAIDKTANFVFAPLWSDVCKGRDNALICFRCGLLVFYMHTLVLGGSSRLYSNEWSALFLTKILNTTMENLENKEAIERSTVSETATAPAIPIQQSIQTLLYTPRYRLVLWFGQTASCRGVECNYQTFYKPISL